MSVVKYITEGAVALITLDRPPVNAISVELTRQIDDAVGEAAASSVRAVVITGEPHFAAGADISRFQDAFDAGGTGELAGSLSSVVRRLEQLAKPVIAAVHGYALGGGLELAMGADFIYLAEDAQVGQPEIKLGIIPGAGGTQRLARLVGLSKARELVYSGRFVDSAEALAIGLAHKVVPAAELVATAMADAARWATGPTVALGEAKHAMNEGLGLVIDEALATEAAGFTNAFGTDDAREGVAAFLAKREASFNGR